MKCGLFKVTPTATSQYVIIENMASVFQKNNPHSDTKALFCEVDGLQALADLIKKLDLQLAIPKVHAVDEKTLSLEYIESRPATSEQWQTLGEQLATLHNCQQKQWGYPLDNYIGLNPQANGLFSDWGQFFYQQRLQFQVSLIQDTILKDELLERLSLIKTPLIDFLNTNCHQSALLHGDLWSGNVMFSRDKVWLIDPAVYWGDPEADIAMTELFGGFNLQFYKAYRNYLPPSPAYALKKTCYNLYHYLNHYNLFGRSYLVACRDHFKRLQTVLIKE